MQAANESQVQELLLWANFSCPGFQDTAGVKASIMLPLEAGSWGEGVADGMEVRVRPGPGLNAGVHVLAQPESCCSMLSPQLGGATC